jgi:hypothetical protein
VWVIYPLGLLVLPLTQALVFWWAPPPGPGIARSYPGPLASWSGAAAILLASALVWSRSNLAQRGVKIPSELPTAFQTVFSLDWLYRGLWSVFRLAGQAVDFISLVLEGEGGFLWTLLILTLLLSFLLRAGL